MIMSVLAGLAAAQGQPMSALAPDGFDPLIGGWACAGYFVGSGRRIESALAFTRDAGTGALVVRHDDSAPNVYHALEVWTSTRGAAPFRAAVANDGGMRWFHAAGWTDGTLTWSRPEEGPPVEQFAYSLQPGGQLQVDWLIARNGAPITLGDRLTCRKR